jgi:hypothetical protein
MAPDGVRQWLLCHAAWPAPAPAGQSLHEYPFACSAQGGCGSFVNRVPVGEQRYQGGVLRSFFQRFKIQPGDPFDVMFGP